MTAPITDDEIAELETQRDTARTAAQRVRYASEVMVKGPSILARIRADAERLALADAEIAASIVERNALRTQLKAAHDALRECANDLEAELKARYGGSLDYPSQRRKYETDMISVRAARAVIEGADHE